MMKITGFEETNFDNQLATRFLKYADMLSRQGLVVNTLGNIAVRVEHPRDALNDVVYTKHMGVSLEEMTIDNVVVTDLTEGSLLYGNQLPSIGHVMNRTVFRLRKDINAVMHIHANDVISYFSVTGEKEMRFISADTALILAKPVYVLDPNINIETDAALLEDCRGQNKLHCYA